MQQPPSILVYGREPGLLRSRTWVFQVAGFQAASAETFEAARNAAALNPVDLLVLCHTLSAGECKEALAWAHAQPEMKRIVITGSAMPHAHLVDEELLGQFASARDLVAAAHRLLPVGQTV